MLASSLLGRNPSSSMHIASFKVASNNNFRRVVTIASNHSRIEVLAASMKLARLDIQCTMD